MKLRSSMRVSAAGAVVRLGRSWIAPVPVSCLLQTAACDTRVPHVSCAPHVPSCYVNLHQSDDLLTGLLQLSAKCIHSCSNVDFAGITCGKSATAALTVGFFILDKRIKADWGFAPSEWVREVPLLTL